MKSKDIRKDNVKKKQPAPTGKTKSLNVSDNGINYRIVYDNYCATVYRVDIDGDIAVYKAANRSWKAIPGFLSHRVQAMTERLYT